MSFVGSINEKLRKFFYTHAGVLAGRKCYIGCSGNFTIEQIITRHCASAEIYSNDVSLYSSIIGHMLAYRRTLPVEFINPELTWANKYISLGPAEAVATILLVLELLKYEKRKNPYSERMWQAYLVNFDSLHEKTLKKVRAAAEHICIKEYTMTDVFDYYPRPDGVSIGFLPTYAGGYEKLFSRLEESVAWDKPAYAMLTEERREATIAKMNQSEYILYDDRERADLPCIARVDLFGKHTVYIYSNLDFRRGLFRKKINEKISPFNLLMPDEEIPVSEVRALEVDLPTINHYRNMFLSKKIQPGSGGPCYLIFAGAKLFGFLIFQAYSQKGGPKDEIYLLSDFVVPSVRHRRLAKLLLMVTQCRDMKEILSEKIIRDYKGILTTAFTDQPVSMKYRGVYELAKRGKGFLNYKTGFKDFTFKEVVKLWMKKYAKQ